MGFHRGVSGNPRQYWLKAGNGKVRSVATDARAGAERGIGRHLQGLVSGPGHEGRGDTDRSIIPRISLLSRERARNNIRKRGVHHQNFWTIK